MGVHLGMIHFYSFVLLDNSCFQPFVDKGHILQLFFPDKYYAVLIPALLLVGGMSVLLTFIGLVMVKSKKKTKSS